MDFLVLCLAATCVLYVNGDKKKSKTDFYPSILDIACKQLRLSTCPAHENWKNRCPEEISPKVSEGSTETTLSDGQEAIARKAKTESANEGSGKSLSKLHPDPETAHTRDLDLIQFNRNITLHQACEEGKLDMVKYILSQALEDINCRGKHKQTPVMTAAREGHVKVFEYLVSHGCDLSAVNDYNNNVLHYACIGGCTEIVRKLIVNERCDIETIGHSGKTPILYAAHVGHREVFEMLMEKGCDLLVTDKYKDNILHLACQGGHVDMVQHILSLNVVSMESKGIAGRTSVLIAAQYGKTKVFDFLVGEGCKVNALDDNGNNILHLACRRGHVDMVQHILSHTSVSIESKGFNGRSPVLIAARYSKTKVFDFLVGEGCKVNALDNNGNNILHLACRRGHVDMVQHILSHTSVSIESKGFNGRSPVLIAARYGKTKVFYFLVGKGCKVIEVDNDKNNVLHLACMNGHVHMVRCILSLNIISIECRGSIGRVPLLIAAESGNKRVFDFLIEKGGDIAALDDDQNNILHVACIGGHVDMVKYLLSLRIVNGMKKSRNKWDRTPLQVADRKGNKSLVNLLKNRK